METNKMSATVKKIVPPREDDSLYTLLKDCLPNDHSRQVDSKYYIYQILAKNPNIQEVMDLGCGPGHSFDDFQQAAPQVRWLGLDIEDSPPVKMRTRTDAEFYTYDGIHIPFESDRFELIYSRQVFEHVRYPEAVLKEIQRVLKPGGYFIGSTSYLEPYHSYSVWNYTPYGFKILAEEAGLYVEEIRPGIDVVSLLFKTGFRKMKSFLKLFPGDSPINQIIDWYGQSKHSSPAKINALKLRYCGQFCFVLRKQG
jgi:ubiquinone/menaquinone biosynthesis C-methylase UbiE